MTFWTEHQLLNQNQFGYLKGKAVLAQMLQLLVYIEKFL